MLAAGADSNGRDRSLFTWRDRVLAKAVMVSYWGWIVGLSEVGKPILARVRVSLPYPASDTRNRVDSTHQYRLHEVHCYGNKLLGRNVVRVSTHCFTAP